MDGWQRFLGSVYPPIGRPLSTERWDRGSRRSAARRNSQPPRTALCGGRPSWEVLGQGPVPSARATPAGGERAREGPKQPGPPVEPRPRHRTETRGGICYSDGAGTGVKQPPGSREVRLSRLCRRPSGKAFRRVRATGRKQARARHQTSENKKQRHRQTIAKRRAPLLPTNKKILCCYLAGFAPRQRYALRRFSAAKDSAAKVESRRQKA
ncbi:hypothetical protein TcCL_NonESM08500 [Trypanosoma cruzi]|nr:hypothetical protein TcCL_NonESM08500 [Trypanosoma cruzi]